MLDAQFFGLAQRRKRVFVIGCLGDWRRAAAVLLERAGVCWDPPPSRAERQVAPTIPSRSSAGGGLGTDFDCDGGLIAFDDQRGRAPAFTLDTTGSMAIARSLNAKSRIDGESETFVARSGVRRLTPRECERLQGFPDGYTAIPGAKDGPRYKALGNSMAVPCMFWIGRRIQEEDERKS